MKGHARFISKTWVQQQPGSHYHSGRQTAGAWAQWSKPLRDGKRKGSTEGGEEGLRIKEGSNDGLWWPSHVGEASLHDTDRHCKALAVSSPCSQRSGVVTV